MHKTLTILIAALLLSPMLARAQQAAPLPAWEQLSAEQREILLTPLRDRWNDGSPQERQRMLQRARDWKDMPAEKRRHALHGVQRWNDMAPEKRREARALYEKIRTLPENERNALRKQWSEMTPEQRHAWVEANPPREDSHPRR